MPPLWAIREAEQARKRAEAAERSIGEKVIADNERRERDAQQAATARAEAEAAAEAAAAAAETQKPLKRQKTVVDGVQWRGWKSGENELDDLLRRGRWPDGRRIGRGHAKPYLQPTYARAIADGTKTVEGRPRSGWAASVSKDDYVRFNISNKGPKLVVRVLEVRTYPTFDAMLEDCAVSACLPGHTGTRADAVRVYRSFASSSGTYDELEAKVGVVAMDVVPLVAPEDEDDEGEGAGDLAGETVTDEPITAHEHERGGGSAHAGGVGAPAAVEQPVWAEEDDGFGW